MATLLRTLRFTAFTLLEYGRSGRIVLELIATAAFFYIFLFRWPLDGAYFFTAVGVFLPLLMLYTMSAMVGLGDRPQGYLVLARRLGRGSYLLGLFLSAMVVAGSVYGLLSALTALINPASGIGPGGWLRGSLPLLLNTGLLAALLLMLSPLVFPTGWRLFVLGLVALAFSGNFISGSIREQLQAQFAPAYTVLTSVQSLLSWPLVPAFSGYALGISRDYSGTAPVILVAQASMLLALLGLALYAFSRRDLIFSQS